MFPALTAIGLFWYFLWRSVPTRQSQSDIYDNENGNETEHDLDEADLLDSAPTSISSGKDGSGVSGLGLGNATPLQDLLPLRALFTESSYQPLLERVLAFSDPKTMLRIAMLSRYHNTILTSSSSLQLNLRKHYHRLPPVLRRSPYVTSQIRRTPASKQLGDLVAQQERIATMDPIAQQRWTSQYVDVLCSGDYVVITRALAGKQRLEGVPEMGLMEDGWSVMVRSGELPVDLEDEEEDSPAASSSRRNGNGGRESGSGADGMDIDTLAVVDVQDGENMDDDDDWEDDPDDGGWPPAANGGVGERPRPNPRRKPKQQGGGEQEPEGWEQWTVEAGDDIADMGVRADDDLVVVAYTVPQERDEPGQLIQIHFYHLETFTPSARDPKRGQPIYHSEATRPVISFRHRIEGKMSVRLRAGPRGRILLYIAKEGDPSVCHAMIWDWKKGIKLGCLWNPTRKGIPYDFSFVSAEIVLVAVSEPVPPDPFANDATEENDSEGYHGDLKPTRLAIRFYQVPDATDQADGSADTADASDGEDTSRCQPLSSFRFPPFTYKYHNTEPLPPDELPPPEPQCFRLSHCSVAAKPAPLPLGSDGRVSTAQTGILVVTLEGTFGPIVHPGHPAHDHISLAFATISVPRLVALLHRRKAFDWKYWSHAVSWDFGPMNWMTGYGTRTVQVSRWVSTPMPLDQNSDDAQDGQDDDSDSGAGATMLNIVLKDYNPTAIAFKGRTYTGILGQGKGVPDTDAPDPFPPPPNFQPVFDMSHFHANDQHPPHPIFAALQPPNLQAPPVLNGNGNPMNPALAQAQAAQILNVLINPFEPLNDSFESLFNPPHSTTRSISARVVSGKSHGKVFEMFGGVELTSHLDYLEVNVNVPVEGEREGDALENPFKTILSGDRLVVCDDGGFDILSF